MAVTKPRQWIRAMVARPKTLGTFSLGVLSTWVPFSVEEED